MRITSAISSSVQNELLFITWERLFGIWEKNYSMDISEKLLFRGNLENQLMLSF